MAVSQLGAVGGSSHVSSPIMVQTGFPVGNLTDDKNIQSHQPPNRFWPNKTKCPSLPLLSAQSTSHHLEIAQNTTDLGPHQQTPLNPNLNPPPLPTARHLVDALDIAGIGVVKHTGANVGRLPQLEAPLGLALGQKVAAVLVPVHAELVDARHRHPAAPVVGVDVKGAVVAVPDGVGSAGIVACVSFCL